MIPSFQYYFPNVIDGINQKHLNLTEYINKQQLIAKKSIWQDSLLSTVKTQTAKPNTAKTETAKTETAKTETVKTETVKTETVKTETVKTETAKPETAKPKTTKTKTTKSETTKTQNESEMMIDDKYLGRIIGRGGIMINQIRTYSNTQITIYRELYNSSKRRIVIFGNQNCIQKAKNNILELCC